MKVKLSIITINYNNKIGLEKTIQSVVNQTYKGFEYIIIDGNSNDGSQEIIEKHKNEISYSISEPDSGIYNGMNKGIKAANGEYVIFMNSGDTFYENTTLAKIEKELINEGIYYGNAIFNFPEKKTEMKYPSKLSFDFFYNDSLCHQSCFIKRTLFEEIFYYNENLKIASDYEFFIYSICIKNISTKHLEFIICNYFLDGISSLADKRDLSLYEKDLILNKYFPNFIDDYKLLNSLNIKRIRQIFHIKNYKITWTILKFFINIFIFILPKMNKNKN